MATIVPDTFRLLLVEDDQDHVVLVKRLLSKCDLDVRMDVAGSAVEAMAALKKTRYHVIIVDFGLPDCTGTASVVALKKLTSETPVIVLTSSTERWLTEEALQFGAEDIFVKSEVSHQLLSHAIRRAYIRRAINLKTHEKSVQHGSDTGEVVAKLQDLIDRCTLNAHELHQQEWAEEVKSIRSELIELALKLEKSEKARH